MKKYKTSKIILLFFLLLSFSGCETVSDCIVAIKPHLISKELSAGTISKNYNDSVIFEMRHANTNDYMLSSVSIDEGKLPPGINYSVGNNDNIIFSGIPTAKGTYEFTLGISVRPYNYNEDGTDDLCGNYSSEKYKIIIN